MALLVDTRNPKNRSETNSQIDAARTDGQSYEREGLLNALRLPSLQHWLAKIVHALAVKSRLCSVTTSRFINASYLQYLCWCCTTVINVSSVVPKIRLSKAKSVSENIPFCSLTRVEVGRARHVPAYLRRAAERILVGLTMEF